jgi:hypothetical protein
MRKGFLIYEEMRKYLVIYEEAVRHVWLCNCSLLNFLIYEENLFSFLSVCALRGLAYVPRPFAIGESAGTVAGPAQLEAAQRPLSQPEADLSPGRRGRVTSHDAADPVSKKKKYKTARF